MNDTTLTERRTKRAERIGEIRQLADWLERNPDATLPYSFWGQHQIATGFDGVSPADGLARVRDFATRHGVEVDESRQDNTTAYIKFGKASYSLLTWHKQGRPGELDERDAELERLRTQIAELQAATGLGYSREDDDPTPVSPARGGPVHTGGVVDGGALVDETLAIAEEHYETRFWVGPGPGDHGAECACGVRVDGFDSLVEASEQLASHVTAALSATKAGAPADGGELFDEPPIVSADVCSYRDDPGHDHEDCVDAHARYEARA